MSHAALRAPALPFAPARPVAPARQQDLTLGMAQLSPVGLSEQWLLRDCGDRHWGLIAEAAGCGLAFRDADGAPIYAAFCATSVTFGAAPALGEAVRIRSSLHAVAPHRTGSLHQVTGPGGTCATVRMISCFLRHDGTGGNTRLLRSGLAGLGALPPAPGALEQLHQKARDLARRTRAAGPGPAHFHYTPVPSLDFNAVGLLYFPVFSKIVEMAAPTAPGAGLRQRLVIYLGNLDPGDSTSVSGGRARALLHSGGRILCVAETS